MKRYVFEATVSGTCSVEVLAESEEEACEKIGKGEWELTKNSEEWDATVEEGRDGYLSSLIETEECEEEVKRER